MRCISTSGSGESFSFEEAVLASVASDGHLLIPEQIEILPLTFLQELAAFSRDGLFKGLARHFLQQEVPGPALDKIIEKSLNFPIPIRRLDDHLYFAELHHGPTHAFKDFGARFLAAFLDYIAHKRQTHFTILVATSGDTGGAVASAFENMPRTAVFILYPTDSLSTVQEQHILNSGPNIHPVPIKGSFDDCQALARQCLNDKDLANNHNFVSANSINLGRLLPQVFYYFDIVRQLPSEQNLRFYVPSGNLGNLCAGLWAKKAGLPVSEFIAAQNSNDVFHRYMQTGYFTPKPLVRTISSAMDVTRPSNMERILQITGSTWNILKEYVSSFSVSQEAAYDAMNSAYKKYNYLIDPHTAVAYSAYINRKENSNNATSIILSTASPDKFPKIAQNITDSKSKSSYASQETRRPESIQADYNSLRSKLLHH